MTTAKILTSLLLVTALALAFYVNLGDAHVTASQGACIQLAGTSDDGAKLCKMLDAGHRLWAVVFDAAIAMAAMAAATLYLLFTRKDG